MAENLLGNTYNEVQAALLNSEMEPSKEIASALYAVLRFAQGEGPGMSKAQIRVMFEEVVSLLEGDEGAEDRGLPECFGLVRSTTDVLCTGGDDPSYTHRITGKHVRPPCDYYDACGIAMGPLVQLEVFKKKAREAHTKKIMKRVT